MRTLDKPFLTLTAADLMTNPVVAVPRSMSLHGAARLLSQAGITGAAVVDGDGRCVGVLSATDFLARAGQGKAPPRARASGFHSAWEMVLEETRPEEEVGDYMTPDPVTAAPTTPIRDLARVMVDAHIHRVVVTDGERRPLGIVSSTDVLAAVASARLAPAAERW